MSNATKTSPKTFTIIKTRKGITTPVTGTIEELTNYYGETLRAGKSYNPKINTQPTTIKGLIIALNKSIAETQRGSYNPTDYELSK